MRLNGFHPIRDERFSYEFASFACIDSVDDRILFAFDCSPWSIRSIGT